MRSMSLSISSSSLPCAASCSQLLAQRFVEVVAVLKRAPQRLAQVVEGVVEILKARVGIVEAGVEEVIGERLQQVFEIDLGGQVAGIFGVANAFHAPVRSELPTQPVHGLVHSIPSPCPV